MNDLTLLDDEAFAEKLEQQWHELLAEQSHLHSIKKGCFVARSYTK